jgi:hypothetical protein
MVVPSGYLQPERRVPGSSMAMASQTGYSATSLFDLEHGLNEVDDSEHPRQEGEQECATAEDEDGISPDDAPELVCDGPKEEV